MTDTYIPVVFLVTKMDMGAVGIGNGAHFPEADSRSGIDDGNSDCCNEVRQRKMRAFC